MDRARKIGARPKARWPGRIRSRCRLFSLSPEPVQTLSTSIEMSGTGVPDPPSDMTLTCVDVGRSHIRDDALDLHVTVGPFRRPTERHRSLPRGLPSASNSDAPV